MLMTAFGATGVSGAEETSLLPYPKDETGITAFYDKLDLSVDKIFGGDITENQTDPGGLNIETADSIETPEEVKPTLETKGGALVLTRNEEKNANQNGFRLYFNADKSLIEGEKYGDSPDSRKRAGRSEIRN